MNTRHGTYTAGNTKPPANLNADDFSLGGCMLPIEARRGYESDEDLDNTGCDADKESDEEGSDDSC